MPKIVDVEHRREEVLEATWRVMAREGFEGVSIRGIAAEAGYSTGVIAHYFRNKDDVVRSALLRVWRREADRIAARTAGLEGLAALRATVAEVLPSGEERKLEMAVWLCFWGRAIGDEALIAEQRRYYGTWRALLRQRLLEAQQLGEIGTELDPAAEAVRLAALIDGVGVQAVFESERFSDRQLPEIVEAHLRALETGGALAGSGQRDAGGAPAASSLRTRATPSRPAPRRRPPATRRQASAPAEKPARFPVQ
ncbi:MAG TPA: TetR/AcrR family transcriptional regulator [Acidimicrobiales bacterium]|nr:TetR/AcrR family transcriptional regulator [Acidimicrobiales bacterium]